MVAQASRLCVSKNTGGTPVPPGPKQQETPSMPTPVIFFDDAKGLLSPLTDLRASYEVRTGAYLDRQAVITDAVQLLRDHAAADEDDDVKLARLNARLQTAIDSLDRGEGIEITDLTAHFDEIEAEVEAEFTQPRV